MIALLVPRDRWPHPLRIRTNREYHDGTRQETFDPRLGEPHTECRWIAGEQCMLAKGPDKVLAIISFPPCLTSTGHT